MSLSRKLLEMLSENDRTSIVINEKKNPELKGLSLTEYFGKVFKGSVSYVNISLDESDEDESLITHSVINGVPFTFKFTVNEDKPTLTVSTFNGESVSEKSIVLPKRMLDEAGDLVIEENIEYMPTEKIISVLERLSSNASVEHKFAYTDKNGSVKSVSHNVNERVAIRTKIDPKTGRRIKYKETITPQEDKEARLAAKAYRKANKNKIKKQAELRAKRGYKSDELRDINLKRKLRGEKPIDRFGNVEE